VSGGHFLSSWESPSDFRRIPKGCGWNLNVSDPEETLVWARFSKSPIRTLAPKNELPLWGGSFFVQRWDSKARPEQSEGTKQSGGLFGRAWESPSNSRRIRYGCGLNLNMSDAEKALVRAHFSKSPIRTLAPKKRGYLWYPLFFGARDGTRKSGPTEGRVRKCPVDTFLARGRVLQIQDASGTDVDWIWKCPIPNNH